MLATTKTIEELIMIINGNLDNQNFTIKGLSLGPATDNELVGVLDAKYQTFLTSAVANEQETIEHGLERTPQGYIVISQDKAGSLYKGTSAWTSAYLYVNSSTASTNYKIITF